MYSQGHVTLGFEHPHDVIFVIEVNDGKVHEPLLPDHRPERFVLVLVGQVVLRPTVTPEKGVEPEGSKNWQ